MFTNAAHLHEFTPTVTSLSGLFVGGETQQRADLNPELCSHGVYLGWRATCRLGVRQIILCGVQTPNCVRAGAYDGISLDYEVTVLSDATASSSPEVQLANLAGVFDLCSCHRYTFCDYTPTITGLSGLMGIRAFVCGCT
jgi:hypothetical protein